MEVHTQAVAYGSSLSKISNGEGEGERRGREMGRRERKKEGEKEERKKRGRERRLALWDGVAGVQ